MKSLNDYIDQYRKQVEKGDIQEAYKGLMGYMMNLRNHFQKKYPEYLVSGSIYFGFMDMTYFSFTPKTLKDKGLKIAIVFIHDEIKFEVWLAGANKQIQLKYWKIFKESHRTPYSIPADTKCVDFIITHNLVDHPDFNDLDNLTKLIEKGTHKFTKDILTFLSER